MALSLYPDKVLTTVGGVAGPELIMKTAVSTEVLNRFRNSGTGGDWVTEVSRTSDVSSAQSGWAGILTRFGCDEFLNPSFRIVVLLSDIVPESYREFQLGILRDVIPKVVPNFTVVAAAAPSGTAWSANRAYNNGTVDSGTVYSGSNMSHALRVIPDLRIYTESLHVSITHTSSLYPVSAALSIGFTVWDDSVISNGKYNVQVETEYGGIVIQVYYERSTSSATEYYTLRYRTVTGLFSDQSTVDGVYNPYFNGTRPSIRSVPYSGSESNEHDSGSYSPDTSDPVPISALPTLSSADTGFTTIYNPNLAQLRSLASYLWSDDSPAQTIWNHVRQLIENPMDVLVSLSIVPCPVPAASTQEFKVLLIGTGIQITKAATQFVQVDCGTCAINRLTEFGSALDYNPYTQISCFLPYIGEVSLDTDEVMGTTLHCYYRIDIVTGACVAIIEVDGSVRYQFSGDCAVYIPFSAADFTAYKGAIVQAAKLVASGISAGMGVPEATSVINTVEQGTNTLVDTVRNPETGRQVKAGTTTETTNKSFQSTKATYRGISATGISNTVGAVIGSKFNVQHSGGFSGNSGYLGIRRPYLTIKRPRLCNPAEYGNYNGYPSMLTLSLGDCTGYTQVQQIRLRNLTATEPEQDEILQLLKGGVIL